MVSKKKWLRVAFLCYFLGIFGVHRFYVGKWKTAVLMLITLGGIGIWTLIDLITIIIQRFEDSEGNVITLFTE